MPREHRHLEAMGIFLEIRSNLCISIKKDQIEFFHCSQTHSNKSIGRLHFSFSYATTQSLLDSAKSVILIIINEKYRLKANLTALI